MIAILVMTVVWCLQIF